MIGTSKLKKRLSHSMGSAVLIRDVLAAGDKVHKLSNYFTDTPPEYAKLSREVQSFYIAVSDLVSQTGRIKFVVERDDGGHASKGKQLKGICDSAATTLSDLEKFIKKNKPPDNSPEAGERVTPPSKNGPKPARTPRTWRRFEDATNIYDLARLEQLLVLNQAVISDFRSSLAATLQNRSDPAIIERQDFLAMAIYELMAGAVSVDEDGEGSRNSAQTPAPVEREKVLAIWTEFNVSEALSRTHQAELDARLDELRNSSTRQNKKKLDDEPVGPTANGTASSLRRSTSMVSLRRKKSKADISITKSLPPPLPGQTREPFSILFDDRTQSHVGALFAHHLRRTLAPSNSTTTTQDTYAANVLNLELCTAPTSLLIHTPTADGRLSAAFLKYAAAPARWRRSLYRPRRPGDAATFDMIIVAGYGGIPTQYAQPQRQQTRPNHLPPRPVAELLCLEDLAGGLRKFSNPLTRSLTTMSGKAAWDKAEKEVMAGVAALVAVKMKGPNNVSKT